MSSYGVGQGFAQGVQSLIPIAENKMRMDQTAAMFDKQLKAQEAWARGLAQAGLPFETEESAGRMPSIPSAATMEEPSQVGRLELPGQALSIPRAPGPAPMAAPKPDPAVMPATGASALAFPSIGRRPQVRVNR